MDPHTFHRHNYEYQFHKHDEVKRPTSPPRKVQNYVSPKPRPSKCSRCCKEVFQEIKEYLLLHNHGGKISNKHFLKLKTWNIWKVVLLELWVCVRLHSLPHCLHRLPLLLHQMWDKEVPAAQCGKGWKQFLTGKYSNEYFKYQSFCLFLYEKCFE